MVDTCEIPSHCAASFRFHFVLARAGTLATFHLRFCSISRSDHPFSTSLLYPYPSPPTDRSRSRVHFARIARSNLGAISRNHELRSRKRPRFNRALVPAVTFVI